MPFFSVIIPTYNRENFISATINSVLEQSFSDFEILIIDDGSTDNTFTLIDKIANSEPKIKYFKIKNSERGAARNFGIEYANGEFLVFLDSDDFFKKDHLKHLYHLIQNNPKINFFASKYDFIENGVVSHAPIFNLSKSIIDYKTLLRGNPFACNICVRRKNMNLIKFPEDRKYSGMEDWIFIFSNLWSQDLFLSSAVTVSMNEHENRSMRFNALIIEKRKNATNYILNNFSLTAKEKNQLNGYSYYFYSIHSFLDSDRKKSLFYVVRAIMKIGLRKDFLKMLMKIILGNRITKNLKRIIRKN